EKIDRWRLLGFRIVEVGPLCDRGAVLRPDRVVEREERREMACDQDDREVLILEAVCVLVDGEVVVQKRQRVSKRVRRRRVEHEPVLSRNLIEPVVHRMASGLPSPAFAATLSLRARDAGPKRGTAGGQADAQLRQKRPACERAPGAPGAPGALSRHLLPQLPRVETPREKGM